MKLLETDYEAEGTEFHWLQLGSKTMAFDVYKLAFCSLKYILGVRICLALLHNDFQCDRLLRRYKR